MCPIQRATGLLVVIFLLGGVCWLDTLDLTDEVLQSQPLMIGLQVIEPEEEGRDFLLSFVTGASAFWLVSGISFATIRSTPVSEFLYLPDLISFSPGRLLPPWFLFTER